MDNPSFEADSPVDFNKRNSLVTDTMARCVCNEAWKGSLNNHPPALSDAWGEAWKVVQGSRLSGNWEELMIRLHDGEIRAYYAMRIGYLRVLAKMMTYEAGLPFFCVVVAIALKRFNSWKEKPCSRRSA